MILPGLRRILSHSCAVLVLLAATIAACWPWCMPGGELFGQRDTAFTVLASRHLQQALLGQHNWTQGPLGWPAPWSVTQADFTAGQGLLAWPIELLGVEPFAAMNVVAFLGVFLTAWCAHRLMLALTGPGSHTWVAGVAAACHPLHLAHAQHVNLVHHEWMVLGALLMGWGLVDRRPWIAFAGGLALLVAPWFGLYMGMQAVMVGGVVLMVAALARIGDRRSWLALGGGLLLGGLAYAPVLATYARVGFLFDVFTDPASLAAWSWDPATTLTPIQRAPLHRWLFGLEEARSGHANNPANPGYLMFSLAVVGLAALRALPGRRWAWGVVVGVVLAAALLAVGPTLVWNGEVTSLPGPYRLLDWIPGFYGLKDPKRWLGVSFTALGLLSGAGAWWISSKTRRWGPIPAWVIGGLLVVMLVAERATPRTGKPELLRLHQVYLELDTLTGPGPLWDNALSLSNNERSCHCSSARAYRAALYHGRPLVSGTAARGTGTSRALQAVLKTWPSPASIELLRAIGAHAVLDHTSSLPLADPRVSCRTVDEHSLCVLQPRLALPDPGSVHTEARGPIVGLRWPESHDSPMVVRCGAETQLASAEVWAALTDMRLGADTPWLDLFLDEPCHGSVHADPTGWIPLYADDDAPPWPTPWRGTGEGMQQSIEDVPSSRANAKGPGEHKGRGPQRGPHPGGKRPGPPPDGEKRKPPPRMDEGRR